MVLDAFFFAHCCGCSYMTQVGNGRVFSSPRPFSPLIGRVQNLFNQVSNGLGYCLFSPPPPPPQPKVNMTKFDTILELNTFFACLD